MTWRYIIEEKLDRMNVNLLEDMEQDGVPKDLLVEYLKDYLEYLETRRELNHIQNTVN